MDIDYLLEEYLKKKGIDAEKVDGKVFRTVVSRIENDIDDYIQEEIFERIAEEWVFLEIEQELDEHPEWKLKEKEIKNE